MQQRFVMTHTESRTRKVHSGNACKLGRSLMCNFEAVSAFEERLLAECAFGPNLLRLSVDRMSMV